MTTTAAPAADPAARPRRGFHVTPKDVAIAAGVGVAQVGLTILAAHHQTERRPLDAWAIFLLAIGPAALVLRRRFPVTVLWVTLLSTAVYWGADYRRGPMFFGLVVAFGTVMLSGHRRAGWTSLGLGWLIFTWGRWAFGWESGPAIASVLGLAAWLLVLGVGMELYRARREQVAGLAHARAEEARRRQSEQRVRIARDLHDVVAHNISLINVQAGVALHLIDERPEQARTALAAIKQASKETLGELRSVLEALRDDDAAPLAPAPGLGDLGRLVERTTAAGLPVHVETIGAVEPLPGAVDLAAFRIVQEAVTNVTRHAAGATRATVRIVYDAAAVTVEVDDDGRASNGASPGAGAGIVGMRERATALGGTLEAGPRPGGGFRVHAWLPRDGDE